MTSRAYLYSLAERPEGPGDRPSCVGGLSEWPYEIPLSYRVLLSGSPALCPSLIADGLEDDDPDAPTPLWAIIGDFEAGFARLRKLLGMLEVLAGPPPPSLLQRVGRRLRGQAVTGAPRLPELKRRVSETLAFLEAHRDRYVLLETVELDMMETSDPATFRSYAEEELALCRAAGEAVDALPEGAERAAHVLASAAQERADGALSELHGLRLDDDFDNTRDGKTDVPLGLSYWSETLYYAPEAG